MRLPLIDEVRTRRAVAAKHRHELDFWRSQRAAEGGRLENGHYEHFFTAWFGLDRSFYAGRRVLDVGCGPRGSLEWCDVAARRVGADPLAAAYRELGAGEHAMEYAASPIEALDEPDGAFDVVTSFNALDHVDDVAQAAAAIVRLLAPGGTLLLATEVGHEPTTTEPHAFGWEVLDAFVPPLRLLHREDLEAHEGGLFAAMLARRPYDGGRPGRPGVLAVRCERPVSPRPA